MPKQILDTSVLRKNIWGIDEEVTEIRNIVLNNSNYTSLYCLKEFLIGVIRPLISFFFVLKESQDTSSAIKTFSNVFSPRVPKLMLNVINDIKLSLTNDKQHDLDIIKMYIDWVLKKIQSPPIKSIIFEKHSCAVSKLKIEHTENGYIDFFNRLSELKKNNADNICKINSFLKDKKNLTSKVKKESTKNKTGTFKTTQAALKQNIKVNNCQNCYPLGDLIISLEKEDFGLVTYEKAINEFCYSINRKCVLLTNYASKKYYKALSAVRKK